MTSDWIDRFNDATRQLRKAADTLGAAERHLRSQAEANAALRMSSEVIASPLCNAVALTKRDIEQWLASFDVVYDEDRQNPVIVSRFGGSKVTP